MMIIKDEHCGVKVGDIIVVCRKECDVAGSTLHLGDTLKIVKLGVDSGGCFWLEINNPTRIIYPDIPPNRFRKPYKNELKERLNDAVQNSNT